MKSREEVLERALTLYQSGFREAPEERIGVESELLLVKHDGSAGNLREFFRTFGTLLSDWEACYDEDGMLKGYAKNGVMVTFDAGTQLELILPPQRGLVELAREERKYTSLLVQVAQEAGMRILGLGIQPLAHPSPRLWNRTRRYDAYRQCLPGTVDVVTITASRQFHNDVPRTHAARVASAMNAAASLLPALAAASSVWIGRGDPKGRMAVREDCWFWFAEEDRISLPRWVDSLEQYLQWLLSLPLLFWQDRDSKYHVCRERIPCVDFLRDDRIFEELFESVLWLHEGCVWPPYRLRGRYGTGEMRSVCQQPKELGVAFEALTLGWTRNWEQLAAFAREFPWEFWKQVRKASIFRGLAGAVQCGTLPNAVIVRDLALEMVAIAMEGLQDAERSHLAPILDMLALAREASAQKCVRLAAQYGAKELIRQFSY
ncbi:hypothetical protein D6779_04075 [Candidatus Parcubacteria bacterium]|nr:MAG: hypothetical protein D6779_04075 [Candidatus Parcubacteria bacterium]